MENVRLILFVALSVVVLLLWQAWQADRHPKLAPNVTGTAAIPPAPAPQVSTAAPPGVPTPGAGVAPAPMTQAVAPNEQQGLTQGQRIRVITDVLIAEIDTVGGDLRQVDLPAYPISVDKLDQPFHLLNDSTAHIFVAQSGLLSSGAAPDHHAHYAAEQSEYHLADGANELQVPLRWTDEHGVTVTKLYTFHRGGYVIDVAQALSNQGSQEWKGRFYRQFQRSRVERESAFIYTYTGGVISTENNKYQKVSFDDMDKSEINQEVKDGWVAMIQHYFLAAWIPPQDQVDQFYSKALGGGRYVLGMVSPVIAVAPGASTTFTSKLYVGPKLQDKLAAVAPHLELTIDYGALTFIAKPLFWLLEWLHSWLHNWGWSIVVLTLLIKLAFYKLSEASYRSMAKMRKFAPKLQQLKERYGDDRQRMSQAMMEIYKKEKINPLGGCLPMLVQIPVFIALYWVLLESVELRQAPFILWIHDLSTKDPYYVLPLIMGATMFLQQKLNPPPPDPLQAKVLSVLPVVFTLFFAFFPSGLVLYWVVNNVLSIAQQWFITHRIEKAAEAKV